jgi:hypothetical protein
MEEVGKHLWEYQHPMYSSDSNYFKKDVGKTWPSWKAFMEETGKELESFCGLVYRWDWEEGENQDLLRLFCINQRKGIYVPLVVMVEKADEPEVAAWLRPRVDDLAALWTPFAGSLKPNPPTHWVPADPVAPQPKEIVGRCDFCQSPDVVVRAYENRRQPECQHTPKNWFCCLCASTHASIAHNYGSDFADTLKTVCFTANCMLAEGEEPDPKDINLFRRYVESLHRALIVDRVHDL